MLTYTPHPDYLSLPPSIRDLYTEEEFAWLSDDQRATVIDRNCMPDPSEFGP